MLNVAALVTNPDLAQPYTIKRSVGSFEAGGYDSVREEIPTYGVVSVPSEYELSQVAEGDRVIGAMEFYCAQAIYETRSAAGEQGLSDLISWRGQDYRIVKVWPWIDYGFYRAIGVRVSGE